MRIRKVWIGLGCAVVQCIILAYLIPYLSHRPPAIEPAWPTRARPLSLPPPLSGVPSICLPVSITTRRSDWFALNQTVLVNSFFPSLAASLSPDDPPVAVYLGYDAHDPLLDRPGAESELRHLLKDVVGVEVRMFRYPDTQGWNVWAVNYLTEECYLDGYSYFYRVNDDTVFQEHGWALRLVEGMKHRPVPDFGVLGIGDPRMSIYTHSVVSRRHFEVFQFHFPWTFGNFWSDDWITLVYQPEHSMLAENISIHHLWFEKRYDVVPSIRNELAGVVESTRHVWQTFLKDGAANVPLLEPVTRDVSQFLRAHCPWYREGLSGRDNAIGCLRRLFGCLSKKDMSTQKPQCRAELSFDRLWRLSGAALSAQVLGVARSKKWAHAWNRHGAHFLSMLLGKPVSLSEDLKPSAILRTLGRMGILLESQDDSIAAALERAYRTAATAGVHPLETAPPLQRNLTQVPCSVYGVTLPRPWTAYADWTLKRCMAPRGTPCCKDSVSVSVPNGYCVAEFFMDGWGTLEVRNWWDRCKKARIQTKLE